MMSTCLNPCHFIDIIHRHQYDEHAHHVLDGADPGIVHDAVPTAADLVWSCEESVPAGPFSM